MAGKDPETGQFAKGNRFWEARSTHGAKPKFSNPDDLWSACCEYFDWVADNPLLEQKGFAFQGTVTKEDFTKMRAMTINGLCMFIDVGVSTWADWRTSRPDLLEVITRAEQVIYEQKFTGAAADLLNPNIIARDLGLADKKELSGKDGGPIETKETSLSESARSVAFLLAKAMQEASNGD